MGVLKGGSHPNLVNQSASVIRAQIRTNEVDLGGVAKFQIQIVNQGKKAQKFPSVLAS